MRLERMKTVRQSRGLTQTELAERIGSNQSYVSKIERGMTVPSRVAERIAETLMCPVTDLAAPNEPVLSFKQSELNPEVLALLTKN